MKAGAVKEGCREGTPPSPILPLTTQSQWSTTILFMLKIFVVLLNIESAIFQKYSLYNFENYISIFVAWPVALAKNSLNTSTQRFCCKLGVPFEPPM